MEKIDDYCNACGQQLSAWDMRISKVLAYKYPCCEACIAKEYDIAADTLHFQFEYLFGERPCLGLTS